MAGNLGGPGMPRRWASAPFALGALALLLAGCGETSSQGGGGLFGAARGAAPAEREVEAPETFQLADLGLWDGRPSLGGVWVAHADVRDPERVRVRNVESGQTVEAALFRRERENPGPRVQVSADAAVALGMLPGQPTRLEIVALRRVAVETAPPPVASLPASDRDDAAERDRPANGPVMAVADPEAAADPPRRRGLLGLFARREGDPAAGRERTGPAAPADTIETAVLAEPGAPGAPVAAAAADLERPFVQAASFTGREAADRAAAMFRDAGVAAEVRPDTGAGGRSVWRVLAGPAATAAERDALLATARRLGFTDAFPARG